MNASLLVSLLFPATGLLLIVLFRRGRSRRLLNRQRKGVGLLMDITRLLVLTQRHRGSSYGVINGDNSLRDTVFSIEQEMARAISTLQSLGENGRQQEHWLAFADHWTRLQRNNLTLEAENNLAQHNHLINVLLYLLEDVAESCCLNEACGGAQEYIWRDLPRTAELIGQARVLGAGIMASGNKDSVHKIRMRFVRSRLEDFLTHGGENNEKLQELMRVIDQQILQENPQTMTAKAYFELSSQAMEPFFRRIDEGLKRLGQQLNA